MTTWKPDPSTLDKEWPLGMAPDGSLSIVAPPPGLTREQLIEWLDVHDDVTDDE